MIRNSLRTVAVALVAITALTAAGVAQVTGPGGSGGGPASGGGPGMPSGPIHQGQAKAEIKRIIADGKAKGQTPDEIKQRIRDYIDSL